MSRAAVLADAISRVVNRKLDAGIAFLRLPELVSPLPITDLLSALDRRTDLRVAIFVHGEPQIPNIHLRVTTEVADAIEWRNDADVEEALLIVGHLERDRAAGLADIPVVTLEEVRRDLFQYLDVEMRAVGAPEPARRLIRTLAEIRDVTDLLACADYCDALSPVTNAVGEEARRQLWRLGLLPDLHDREIDERRLGQNMQLVSKIRATDASTRQRLIRHASSGGGADYTPLRRFSATGDPRHLANLDYESVLKAVRAASGGNGKSKKGGREDSDPANILAAISDSKYDQDAFLTQIRENEGKDNPSITAGGSQVTGWDYTDFEPVESLFVDPDRGEGYEVQAGSVEKIRADEPFPMPGKGAVDWRNLEVLATKLRKLEMERAKRHASPCADLVDRLIQLRRDLVPYRSSIPNEGLRLFIGSEPLRRTANTLLQTWVELWHQLDTLRTEMPAGDHVHVRRLAEQLASTDLRVTVQGGSVDAYVLPLHPLIVEPRVRAAELFLNAGGNSADLFELVAGALDPAMPSISILHEGAPVSLGYSGQYRGTLHYSRTPRQIDSGDVFQSIRQLTQRFTNVHPYAELSLAVGLYNPPVKVAKSVLKWLGEGQVAERVNLYVFGPGVHVDELREALDEAREELTSGEVSLSTFDYDVLPVADVTELEQAMSDNEHVPHLLFMFDTADVEQSAQGGSFETPPLGSLISEWVFDTDPLEDSRPLISPRSGSSLLTEYVEAQAGLFEMPLPAQQRSPLLSNAVETTLQSLAEHTTWVVLCEGVSSLVPPLQIGDLHLVGRQVSTSHVAFVYSGQILLMVEPVLAFMQQSMWIAPDGDAAVKFLLGTVRMALPEGLLGFFKTRGTLSRESVLGRLGLAAAVAYLDSDGEADRLLVSLDSEGARRWLGLREGSEKRADLLVFSREGDTTVVEAVEVKARSTTESWGSGAPPQSVVEALGQVRVMESLLRQVFRAESEQPLTPSRREILKRQVFLEALQQWEPIRHVDESRYQTLLDQMNDLFGGDSSVEIRSRIFLVSSTMSDEAELRQVSDADGSVPVVTLGVPWLKKAMQEKPGGAVEIPLDLLDELGLAEDYTAAQNVAPEMAETDQEASPLTLQDDDLQAAPVEQPGASSEMGSGAAEDVERLAEDLRAALVARKAPFKSISVEQTVIGPSVVQIPFAVTAGAKLSGLQSQEDDLARDLGVQSVRIINWPGKPGYAMAELPRIHRDIPDVGSLMTPHESRTYPQLALGAQVNGEPLWVSIDQLPHLLVAGTTGSGKSVFIRSLLWQLTSLHASDEVEIVLIDAKGLADYLDFAGAPHFRSEADFHLGVDGSLSLLEHVVQNRLPERSKVFREYASAALRRTEPVQISNLRQLRADAFAQGQEPPLKPLVVIIDEFAELVLGGEDRKHFETLITRFTQVARAVGGHLIAATQRPSTDIVTGVMKSNFARVGLKVQQAVDSRVILDEGGAELLLGRGDLLFKSADVGLVRLQGYSAIGPYRF